MNIIELQDFPVEYVTALFWTPPQKAEEREDWPAQFGIISGYATTGERWPEERNRAADRRLEQRLRAARVWIRRVEVTSPDRSHREPSWAVARPWEDLCDLGKEFLQVAIYYVIGDRLYLSYCDRRRQLVEVGAFRDRVREVSE
jgi:hypothetical protein